MGRVSAPRASASVRWPCCQGLCWGRMGSRGRLLRVAPSFQVPGLLPHLLLPERPVHSPALRQWSHVARCGPGCARKRPGKVGWGAYHCFSTGPPGWGWQESRAPALGLQDRLHEDTDRLVNSPSPPSVCSSFSIHEHLAGKLEVPGEGPTCDRGFVPLSHSLGPRPLVISSHLPGSWLRGSEFLHLQPEALPMWLTVFWSCQLAAIPPEKPSQTTFCK